MFKSKSKMSGDVQQALLAIKRNRRLTAQRQKQRAETKRDAGGKFAKKSAPSVPRAEPVAAQQTRAGTRKNKNKPARKNAVDDGRKRLSGSEYSAAVKFVRAVRRNELQNEMCDYPLRITQEITYPDGRKTKEVRHLTDSRDAPVSVIDPVPSKSKSELDFRVTLGDDFAGYGVEGEDEPPITVIEMEAYEYASWLMQLGVGMRYAYFEHDRKTVRRDDGSVCETVTEYMLPTRATGKDRLRCATRQMQCMYDGVRGCHLMMKKETKLRWRGIQANGGVDLEATNCVLCSAGGPNPRTVLVDGVPFPTPEEITNNFLACLPGQNVYTGYNGRRVLTSEVAKHALCKLHRLEMCKRMRQNVIQKYMRRMSVPPETQNWLRAAPFYKDMIKAAHAP